MKALMHVAAGEQAGGQEAQCRRRRSQQRPMTRPMSSRRLRRPRMLLRRKPPRRKPLRRKPPGGSLEEEASEDREASKGMPLAEAFEEVAREGGQPGSPHRQDDIGGMIEPGQLDVLPLLSSREERKGAPGTGRNDSHR